MTTTNVVPIRHGAPTHTKFQALTSLTWGQLEAHRFPPRHFIIDPILRERQVGMVYAPAGVGKTWFTLSLAVLAASGQGASFLGLSAHGEGDKVLILDGEMDIEDLQQRIGAVVKATHANEDNVRRNLVICSRQKQRLDTEFADIADEDWQMEILAQCQRDGIKLLVLDNLSTLAPSIDDENSAAKMSPLNGMLLKAKQAGVSCLLVHHATKAGGTFRGSSVIAVALDLNISLRRPDNYMLVDGETAFVLEYTKVRGQIPREMTNPRVVAFRTSQGVPEWVVDDHPATQGQLYRQLLETLKFASQKELAAHLHESEATVSRKLKQAVAAGVFTQLEQRQWFKQAKEVREAGTSLDAVETWAEVETEDGGQVVVEVGDTTSTPPQEHYTSAANF